MRQPSRVGRRRIVSYKDTASLSSWRYSTTSRRDSSPDRTPASEASLAFATMANRMAPVSLAALGVRKPQRR
jgi:hypothetical protein